MFLLYHFHISLDAWVQGSLKHHAPLELSALESITMQNTIEQNDTKILSPFDAYFSTLFY